MVKKSSLVKVVAGPFIFMQGTVIKIEGETATVNDCHVPQEWPEIVRHRKVQTKDLELLTAS